MFIFNTDLLLIDVSWFEAITVFILATVGILVFMAATMGWFVTRLRIWESLTLLLVAFALLHPAFFMNKIQPPFKGVAPTQFTSELTTQKPGIVIQAIISGPYFNSGEIKSLMLPLTIPAEIGVTQRISKLGLDITKSVDQLIIAEPPFGSAIAEKLKSFDFYGLDPITGPSRLTKEKSA